MLKHISTSTESEKRSSKYSVKIFYKDIVRNSIRFTDKELCEKLYKNLCIQFTLKKYLCEYEQPCIYEKFEEYYKDFENVEKIQMISHKDNSVMYECEFTDEDFKETMINAFNEKVRIVFNNPEKFIGNTEDYEK